MTAFAKDQERPYLVLTLRRTGGTSLMGLMARLSSFPIVQHEPFNGRRVWGKITQRFRADRDVAAMEASIAATLEPRPNIKHCFEFMPPRLTQALIRQCHQRGYRIFTLVRRDGVARLRSLAIAEATGAWGPRKAESIYPRIRSGEQVLKPIDLKALERRYAHDIAATKAVFGFLDENAIDYTQIVFEDLYARDGEINTRVCALLRDLGISITPDDPRLGNFAAGEGQGTSSILPYLPNRKAFEAFIEKLSETF